MRKADKRLCDDLVKRFCAARSSQLASDWAEENLTLNEPKIKGRFSFNGREYLREIIDAWGPLPPSLIGGLNFIFVAGTGSGKTISTIAGTCYRLENWPMRQLIVKPSANGPAGAGSFSRTRLQPTIKATKCLAEKIPTGMDRFNFSTNQMMIAGSVIDLTGSNSVGQLGENRCDVVLQDEIDKYPEQKEDDKEAGPIVLADERTKNVIGARRYKYSTPTLPGAGVWAYFRNSDMRRRLLPCPHCNPSAHHTGWKRKPSTLTRKEIDQGKVQQTLDVNPGWVFLVWSKKFTVFELTGNEAIVEWDSTAKVDGIWDYDKVERTAHYTCPHCKGEIKAIHLQDMDAGGHWVQTAVNPIPGEIGWHLPSLYSTSPDCAIGKLAVKFLKAKRSPEGVKGFINSDLAEPHMNQELRIDKVGLAARQIEITNQWLNLLTIDFQQVAPYFRWMVRSWDGGNKTHGLEFGSAMNWYEIDEIQKKHSIIPQAVGIDIGFNQAQVLAECADLSLPNRCQLDESIQDGLPMVNGWNPMKSYGGKKLFQIRTEEERDGRVISRIAYQPFRKKNDTDPFAGTEMAHRMRIETIEWLSDWFEDAMENIRMGKTNIEWTISPECDVEEYHEQMAGKHRVYSKKDPRAYKWETVSQGYPDHIHVCEVAQIVLACRLELLSWEAMQTKKEKK
ncbi:MAG: phage terminase large subunit family protein [Patescibacteria group bacterium]|nr:phage terminase large subunit family protein [Patescibacteria group bacterium]